ncbi:MAG TPA: histidine kinase [Actinomycetota bacterium]|nr:histidine kinase [Actinomycetota bacterium]
MKTRAPWVLAGFGAVLAIPVVWFSVLNGSFSEEVAFIPLALVAMTGWATVGALLASRNPGNPIGWLMITFGLGFMVIGFADEWATYALRTDPGTLPLGTFWLWVSNWWFLGFVSAIPILLVLYPTGSVPTRRWRALVWAVIGTTLLATVASMLKPGPMEIDGLSVPNPAGVPALDPAIDLAQTVAGIGYTIVLIPLCILAVILRFRRASGEERQQIRWLAYTSAIGGTAFIAAVVSGINLEADETNLANEIAFYVFFVAVGLGIPASIGVALLKYRLWDLDVVLKKTLVATVLVVLIIAMSVLALVVLSAILVDPVSDEPWLTLLVGLAVGALAWPLLRLASRVADRIVYGGRATPYEVLTDFSGRMAESYATEDVLPRMASILGAGAGADAVTIWLRFGDELRPAAGWPASAEPPQTRRLPLYAVARSGTFEVRHHGELLGAIAVEMPPNDPLTPSKERLIRDLASQAGLVLRNVRLIEELRESRRRIVAAVDEGRRRLERNIHDGAQQQLVALAVKLRLAEGAIDRDPAAAKGLLGQLQHEANDALENLRDLARGIYPPLLADKGLAAAVEAQVRKLPMAVRVTPDGLGRYPQEVEAGIYFCVLEALQNVAKYAQASTVDVEMRESDGRLWFAVRDDGVGFDPGAAARGTGLQSMEDRIEAVGGSFRLESAPGRGTTVTGVVPVETGVSVDPN